MNAQDFQEQWERRQLEESARQKPVLSGRAQIAIVSIWVVILTAVALSACAPRDIIASGNESSVIVQQDGSVASASALAQGHCQKYGRNARLAHSQGFMLAFDCVGR
ncbi:MAG: hypothetical protein VW338_05005 [Rhodospirillaceae bacterium]